MKIRFTYIVIAVLAIIVLLLTCGKSRNGKDVVIKSDTVVQVDTITWVKYDTFYTKPNLIKSEPITNTVFRDSIITKYSSINCDSAIRERDELLALYTTQNEYYDGHWITDSTGTDTLAFVSTIDTVAANSIIGKRFTTQIWGNKINTTTTIIKTTSKKRTQLYIGGELGGNKQEIFSLAGLGLLLKTKKDNLYEAKATLDLNGKVYYSIQCYKLISFRKK